MTEPPIRPLTRTAIEQERDPLDAVFERDRPLSRREYEQEELRRHVYKDNGKRMSRERFRERLIAEPRATMERGMEGLRKR